MNLGSQKRKGISLVEIVVAIAIVFILTAIVSFSFVNVRRQQALQNSVSDIESALHKASSATLASLDASEYGVHFDTATNSIVLFKGKIYSPSDVNNENISLNNLVSISNINLSGSVVDVYFNRLTNVPSATGKITISSGSSSKVVTISPTGSISVD